FADLADGGFYRVFTLIDQAFRKGEDRLAGADAAGATGWGLLFFGLNGRDIPVAGHAPEDHAASRKLAYHAQTS
ncbi:MAG: hypothetical protein DMG82_08295, partial [Acidobacteria bacterium]